MVKMLLGFISGITVCVLLLFGLRWAMPTRAQSETLDPSSDNVSLVELLPDIEKIYQEALYTPFEEAEKKIYDPDVAQFYHLLLGRAGLDRSAEGAN